CATATIAWVNRHLTSLKACSPRDKEVLHSARLTLVAAPSIMVLVTRLDTRQARRRHCCAFWRHSSPSIPIPQLEFPIKKVPQPAFILSVCTSLASNEPPPLALLPLLE